MSDDQILIRQLRDQVSEQAEEIRQLKLLLAPEIPMPAEFPRLTPRETEIMRMLLAHGEVRQTALKTLIPDYVDDAENYLKVYVCRIRRKIEPHGYGIRNFRGASYELTRPLDAATQNVA